MFYQTAGENQHWQEHIERDTDLENLFGMLETATKVVTNLQQSIKSRAQAVVNNEPKSQTDLVAPLKPNRKRKLANLTKVAKVYRTNKDYGQKASR